MPLAGSRFRAGGYGVISRETFIQAKAMTEAQLIHDGWRLWNAPTVYIGTQWSYEDTQAMGGVKPLVINRISLLDDEYRRAQDEANRDMSHRLNVAVELWDRSFHEVYRHICPART